MEIEKLSIRELGSAVRAGKLSAKESAEFYFRRIEQENPKLNAYLSLDREGAFRAASEIDERVGRGEEAGLLAGVPIAVKDNILVKGLPATAASKMLEPYRAAYDAAVIRKLREAGAVILGKTNLDEFAMGGSTENSAFGPTKNPHDLTRVPGGSSGGSAAAVAAGLAKAALGSDTGGSIRQPAAFSGVVGMKPTYGRVSRHGLIAMASSLDQIGPLTRSVDDAEALYRVIAGPDRYDSTTRAEPERSEREASLKGLRIGVPREYFAEGLDARVKEKVESALKLFEKRGASLIPVSLPHTAYSLSAYYIVMPAEVSANLARFDGLRYGHRAASDNLLRLYRQTREEGFGKEVKRRIMIGTYVLSHGYYDAFYVKASAVRSLIREDFINAFKSVDVIMGPTTPSVAFKLGEKSNDPLSMYLEDIYTVSANLAGVPAISIPCGMIEEGGVELPAGLQLTGKWFEEADLFQIAKVCEKVLNA